MASYNKQFLLGNVGNIDSRTLNSGVTVVDISLATSNKWTDKASGEKKERTEWHKLVAFDRKADVLAQYVSKGDPLFVVGETRTEKWQDKDGNDRYTTKVYIDDFQLLGSRGGRDSAPSEETPASKPAPKADEKPFEDDIPF
jgi:single-strand DNA-binding protein